jgi:type II secretory pathway pseudopilin PulG
MSEIKGQLLGIVLVLAVFGVISGVLISAFQNSANKIKDEIEKIDGKQLTDSNEDSNNSNNGQAFFQNSYSNLLTF